MNISKIKKFPSKGNSEYIIYHITYIPNWLESFILKGEIVKKYKLNPTTTYTANPLYKGVVDENGEIMSCKHKDVVAINKSLLKDKYWGEEEDVK